MKRIIDGKTYNTHTATEVTGGSHPYSDGWWGMYQTRHGAFFKILVDHDGETVLEFKPLTDAEAQAVLEKHANHLLEQYFGPFQGGASERRLTIRVPGNLAERLEVAAQAKGLSLNSYAMRCFERCAAEDGQAAGRQ